ncbi:MAG: hypothetical protein Q7U47_04840 [Paludibacter sp.]|nr:hypothetical protein [Paludibacter sp.]
MKSVLELMVETQKKFSRKKWLDFYIDLMIRLIVNEKWLEELKTLDGTSELMGLRAFVWNVEDSI